MTREAEKFQEAIERRQIISEWLKKTTGEIEEKSKRNLEDWTESRKVFYAKSESQKQNNLFFPERERPQNQYVQIPEKRTTYYAPTYTNPELPPEAKKWVDVLAEKNLASFPSKA